MTTVNDRAVDEARIRGLIDGWVNALRAKDADGILRHFAPDVVIFDLAPPLKSMGANRKAMETWLDTWRGPIDYEVTDLSITVGGDLAFAATMGRTPQIQNQVVKMMSAWARPTTIQQPPVSSRCAVSPPSDN